MKHNLNLTRVTGRNCTGSHQNLWLLLLLFGLLAKAQVNVEWSNDPGGVAVTTDLSHQVYSANWDYNPAGDITLTKRSPDGTVLWNASYDNTDNTRHEVANWVATDSQGHCIVGGSIRSGFSNPVNAASLLMKFDADGNLLWRNVFESSFEGSYTRKILVDGDDNIYVLGLGMGDNGLVTRIKKCDPNGATLWNYYDNDGVGAPINFKFTPDNALVVSARGIIGIVNGYFKLGLDGTLIWSLSGMTSPTVGDAAGDSLGNTYTINGESAVVNPGSIIQKWDPSGALIWSRTNDMAGSRIETTSGGDPIVSGFPNAGTAGAAFMKYGSDGTVLWQNLNADGPEMLLLHGQLLLDTTDNAYLSAGNLFNMAVCKINADGTNGWVGLAPGSNSAQSFTVDSDAVYLIGGTTAKLSETTMSRDAVEASAVTVTPNPFDEQLSLTVPHGVGERTVRLYSINGGLVYETGFYGDTAILALPQLPSGIFMLHIVDESGRTYWRKMVKR